jgi:PAN domain
MGRIAMPVGFLIVASALMVTTLSIADTIEKDTNRPGGDYKNFAAVDGLSCKTVCSNERPRCKAWTWVRKGVQGPDARCWLKASVPPPVPDKNCISGKMEVTGQRIDPN